MSLEMDKNLETRLKKARPSGPSELLGDRIAKALQARQRQAHMARIRQILSWGGLAAAASVLITCGILLFHGRLNLEPAQPGIQTTMEPAQATPVAAVAEDDFQPVVAENNLKSRVDEGIVFLRNGLTARRYRYEFIDRVVWKNPSDGSVIEMEVPRDEVVLVPVQTF